MQDQHVVELASVLKRNVFLLILNPSIVTKFICRLLVTPNAANKTITVQLADNPSIQIAVTCNPFRLDVYDENEPVFSLNSRHLLNIEHLREKPIPKP